MKTLNVLSFCALAFAVSLPLPAQMVVTPLSSPVLAAGGGGTASQESPFADRFNPAASAGKQRVTFDTAYFGLVSSAQSGYGNAFNLGLTVPARWGVVTGGASYWGSPFTNLALGDQGQVTLGLSKDLWEDFYVGANLNTAFGTGGWGLGGSLGFLHFIGNWGILKDLRWGGVLRDMGKAYTTTSGYASPAIFTPAVGAEFDLWRDDTLRLTMRPDLSLPSFQDLNASLGSTLAFGDVLNVNLALRFDLRDTLKGLAAEPFSFGVGFHFFTDIEPENDVLGLKERGWNRNEVRVATAALPLTGGVWALGAGANIPLGVRDTTPPVVKVETGQRFISPNNDGSQDALVLPVAMTDERYIVGYTLQVFGPDKSLVRTLQSRITLPEAQGLDQIVNRLLYVKHGIDIPQALEWNGNTDAGTVAPDGTYTLQVTAWDDNNNRKDWNAGSVVVKNTPPTVNVSASYLEFNPVGDRSKLPLVQRGSPEEVWTGTFADSRGTVVATRTWTNGPPTDFEWDGRGADGKVVPDGVYSYAVTATDRAGNRVQQGVSNLIVNSVPTPLDLKVNRTAFSPGGNGVKALSFQPKAGVTTGMTDWKLDVQDKKGLTVKSFQGKGQVPADLVFDGRDGAGTVLADGEYRAKLSLTYTNGNTPSVVSPPFTVKNGPPVASVTAPEAAFSPGEESGRGVMVFQQTTSDEDVWTGKLSDASGKVLRTVRWPGKADATYLWDGRGSDGKILDDGPYTYRLEATDRAGNVGVSEPVTVVIDTAERSVLLASDRGAFTPASSGPNGKVRFTPQLKEAKGLSAWTLTVQDAAGNPVVTWKGTTDPTGQTWDGKDAQGQPSPDGIYTAHIVTSYSNGTTQSAKSNAVLLKSTLPKVTVSAEPTLFSPTPGSSRPVVTIKQSSSNEAEWTGVLTAKDGTPVRAWRWKGQVESVVWDGTDDAGNRVPDGTYRYEVKTTDAAENSVVRSVDNLTVDTRPTPLFLTVSADGFSPNGDGNADTITLNTRVGLNEGISSWRLEISSESGGVRRSFDGKGPVPAQFVWDGLKDQGSRAEDGRYSARLAVSYEKGNQPETRSAAFVLQAGPPLLSLEAGPQPFSPDNDGLNDELLFNLGVKAVSPVADWTLEVLDPEGHRFIVFNGKGTPSTQLKWDGRSGTGELVQSASDYTAVFTARDSLGNTASVKKSLAVDVLVLKDGDRLRIIIPSITFAPNSPDFLRGVDADRGANETKIAKNIAVLKRLAEIFAKYQRYRIGIEGHAVMINYADPVRGKKEQDGELLPLSKQRADAVRDYLVTLGIAAARITTEGIGGARPVVPFSDLDNRWKNRRVEFLLERD